MRATLNLIKTEFKEIEKRTFPRFPFSNLVFKISFSEGNVSYFSVKDFSFTGMQINIEDFEKQCFQFQPGKILNGNIKWDGDCLHVQAKIEWIKKESIGLSFNISEKFKKDIYDFLSPQKIISHLKALHFLEIAKNYSNNLKYWLKADGVFELFIWEYSMTGISKIQMSYLGEYVEWEESLGFKTAKIIRQKNLDRPLTPEDELVFEVDEVISSTKIQNCLELIQNIPENFLSKEALYFLNLKLRV